MLKRFPRAHLAAAAALGAVVGITMISSPSADVEAKRTSVSLDLESGEVVKASAREVDNTPQRQTPDIDTGSAAVNTLAATETAPAEAVAPATAATDDAAEMPAPTTQAAEETPELPRLSWSEYEIESGDNLSALFKQAGFSDGLMLKVINGEGDADKVQRLYVGETISFATNQDGELVEIELQRTRTESLRIHRNEEDRYVGEINHRQPEIRTTYAEAEIDSSLFGAGQSAGLTDKLTMELANIFGWDIDFIMDIRKGDRFSVVYEELYLDGEKIDNGRILAAEFYTRGRELAAVLYTDDEGNSEYFTPEGQSMRKAFLRTPVDFARISSNFNLQRRHPVLNKIRAHRGTDYAAQPGTPIKAAGDGKVIHVGRKGGYGNTVIVQHGQAITTLYAHMKGYARNMRSGTRVKQGQVIGYVGSSGLATGPHLHYEFRVNGQHRDPVKVKFPNAEPVPQQEMVNFKSVTEDSLAQLETYQDSRRMTLARGE